MTDHSVNATISPDSHVHTCGVCVAVPPPMQTGIDRYLSVFGDSHNSGFNEHSRFVLFQFLLVVGCIGGFKGGAVQGWTVIPFQTVRKRVFLCVYVCSVIANRLSGLTVKICL